MIGRYRLQSRDFHKPVPLTSAICRAVEGGERWVVVVDGAEWEYDDLRRLSLDVQRELESRWSDVGQVGTYQMAVRAYVERHLVAEVAVEVERP